VPILTAGQGDITPGLYRTMEIDLPNAIRLAYLPSLGSARLRLSSTGPVKEDRDKAGR
jgi:nicotinamide-nucleotide amidase